MRRAFREEALGGTTESMVSSAVSPTSTSVVSVGTVVVGIGGAGTRVVTGAGGAVLSGAASATAQAEATSAATVRPATRPKALRRLASVRGDITTNDIGTL